MPDAFDIYHKPTFDNISKEKRQKILTVAVQEFATQGFENANINTIAKKAEVSVGSLYKYFDTKTDLFLTCVGHEISFLGQLLQSVTEQDDDIMLKFEKLIRAALTFSRENAIINKLYNEFTTESNIMLGAQLVEQMEALTAKDEFVIENILRFVKAALKPQKYPERKDLL